MTAKGEKKRRRALQAYDRLQRAAARTSHRVERAIASHGLNASQFGVLSLLAAKGPVHQQELAQALGRSKAQMTAIIDVLEQRALVHRVRRETDKRFFTVHLTDAGRELFARVAPDRDAAIVELMTELTGRDRVRLARLCRRLLRALDSPPTNGGNEDVEPAAVDALSVTS